MTTIASIKKILFALVAVILPIVVMWCYILLNSKTASCQHFEKISSDHELMYYFWSDVVNAIQKTMPLRRYPSWVANGELYYGFFSPSMSSNYFGVRWRDLGFDPDSSQSLTLGFVPKREGEKIVSLNTLKKVQIDFQRDTLTLAILPNAHEWKYDESKPLSEYVEISVECGR